MFYCCFHFEKFYLSAAANHHKFMMLSRFKGPGASIALDNLKMSASRRFPTLSLRCCQCWSAWSVRIVYCYGELQVAICGCKGGEVECGWGVEWVGYRLLWSNRHRLCPTAKPHLWSNLCALRQPKVDYVNIVLWLMANGWVCVWVCEWVCGCVPLCVCLLGGGLRLAVIRICVSCGRWLPSIASSSYMLISDFSFKSEAAMG